MIAFDDLVVNPFNSRQIVYGIMYPAEPGGTVLLIKKGQDKEEELDDVDISKRVRGYDDKYVRMADYYSRKRNITVFVASNPFDGFDSVCDAVGVINDYYIEMGISKEEQRILYMGHSYGAVAGGLYAHNYPQITDMVLVNMPPKLSLWEKMVKGMQAFMDRGSNLIVIYGENDPSYLSSKMLFGASFENLNLLAAEEADHHFTGQTELFMRIPELFWAKCEDKEK